MKDIKEENFFEITVKAVVLNPKNEVLLLKREKNDASGAGKYDFPGGKLEAGENIEEGLKREINEETGLETEIETVLLAFDFGQKYDKEYLAGDKKLCISGKGIRFLARAKSDEVKLSDEHEEYKWVSLDEALKMFGNDDFEWDKKESIVKAKKYLEMYKAMDGWKRAVADFENYKKREAESKKDMASFMSLNLILQILPVVDNFQVSTEHIPADQKDNQWVTGIMHIQRQLENILADNGVKQIEVKVGEKFNPAEQEAVEDKECEKDKECKNIVKKVIQKGYKIGERVIRLARVIVE